MTFEDAVKQGKQEVQQGQDPFETACKYADIICDDFGDYSNIVDALQCEITEMFQD